MFRFDPPSTVDWYDVDVPEVVAARRQLVPDAANAHAVAGDLTDTAPSRSPASSGPPGFDDPHEPERWNPRLRLVDEILPTREPEVAQFPPALRFLAPAPGKEVVRRPPG